MRLLALLVGATGLLAACTSVQTSSGADYLSSYEETVPGGGGVSSDEFRAAAGVEPLLRFPAKIGLARIENGRLTSIPDTEMTAWAGLAEEAGGQYGSFQPLNLLVAEMATPAAPDGLSRTEEIVRKIRLGAARQHMDAVFVYEVFGTADNRQNALSVGDLTILGAFILPGRNVEAVGHAEGLLIDVRNAYPYISLSETVDRDSLATGARAWGRGQELKDAAMTKAVEDLVAEAGPALAQLAEELSGLDKAQAE